MNDSEDSNFEEVDQLVSEDEYEVEAVVDHRKRGSLLEYLVKWKDYSDESNTWEPSDNLADAQKIVAKYYESLKTTKQSKKRGRKQKQGVSGESISSRIDDETNNKGGSTGNRDEAPTSNTKKIKIMLPTNTSSPRSKNAKLDTGDDDVDEIDFVDANATGFGFDGDSDTKELKQSSLNGVFRSIYDDRLDRIDYKLENEDGISQKIKVIVDEKYPAGDINWEDKVEDIVVLIGKNGADKELRAILRWDNGEYSLHSISDIRKACPQVLIDYYHRYLLF